MPRRSGQKNTMTKNLSEELQRNARQALAGLQPAPQGQEAGGLPVLRLLSAFFRARYLVFGTTLFGVLVGLFMAIKTPNNYVSTGKFLFNSTGAEAQSVDATRATDTNWSTIETAAAYILDSDDLLRRVVDKLGPARILQPYSPGGEDDSGAKALFFKIQRDWNKVDEANYTVEEALKHLQHTVAVERPRFMNVLIATCNANDPQLAQEILSTYMDEAVKWHIEKYENNKAYEDAKNLYEENVRALEEAQRAMHTFLDREAREPDFDQHKQLVVTAKIEAEQRLANVREEISIKTAERDRTRERLADPEKLPPTRTRRVRVGASQEEMAELYGKLAEAKMELRAIVDNDKNSNSIERIRAEKRFESLRLAIDDIKEERKSNQYRDEIVENPAYQSAIVRLDELEQDLIGLEAQREQAQKMYDEKNKELLRILSIEPKYDQLYGKLESARSLKGSSEMIWEAAQKKRALGLGNYSSLKPFQEATLPLEKEGPNRGKSLIGGLFVGLFLGIGIVILRTLPDSVVRTRDDLEHVDGLAVIGVMPRLDRTNLRRHIAMREQGW